MTNDSVGAPDLVEVVTRFRSALERHESTINRLNVFPVPDGDTGTNMLRTVEAAERAVAAGGDPLVALAKGSLMGARGNSGVILSQILRALTAAFVTHPLDAEAFAGALRLASDAAYASVLRPVEGTILTVARGASEAADGAGTDVADVALAARDGAIDALARTPDLLPVLREAGVVDAGGAGLVQLYEAFVSVIVDAEMPVTLGLPSAVEALIATAAPRVTAPSDATPTDDLRYEVMFLLETADAEIDGFKTRWAAIGDSIVVVGGDGIYNCHIHTSDIGGSLDAAVEIGRPLEIRVTDLREQVGALESGLLRVGVATTSPFDLHRNPSVTDVVAVASGSGVASILRSLGVAEIIEGGQSMNPSTEELLGGIGSAVSRDVIVLPNNANIIPVANEAAKLAGRAVVVVPTTSVQAGIAALVAYDPGATAESNAPLMNEAAGRVTAGEV
ncbi:MAG TPA: DAK2 domain-containing protein, partial [Acidimicrobiales bacterium]|nr:DAK2 domain-containing protein [Acidimicrobiales bacterium]